MSEFPLAATVDGTTEGENPDLGRMFDVPRIAVILDESDPNILKLAFSGTVEMDRDYAAQVEFYNALKAGEAAEIIVSVHVAGASNKHRRDSEGLVDAIVQTKSLIVTDVSLDRPVDD